MGNDEQQAKIRKIQLLLNKAESTTNEEERHAYQAMADKIIQEYGIDEELLAASRPAGQREEPVSESFDFATWRWVTICREILEPICVFAGVKYVIKYNNITIVGFPTDVRYAEMMFTAAKFTLLAKMEAKWDQKLTEDENVTMLYEAGWKWRDIALEGGFDWPDGGKLIRAYKRQCKREERQPVSVQDKEVYVRSFASAFVTRLATRLYTLTAERADVRREAGEARGVSGELVLVGRGQRTEAAFYNLFPELHPDAIARKEAELLQQARDKRDRALAEREAMLATMTPKQREQFLGKEERTNQRASRWTQADERAWQRQNRMDHNGVRNGQAAADSVNLGGSAGVQTGKRGELS